MGIVKENRRGKGAGKQSISKKNSSQHDPSRNDWNGPFTGVEPTAAPLVACAVALAALRTSSLPCAALAAASLACVAASVARAAASPGACALCRLGLALATVLVLKLDIVLDPASLGLLGSSRLTPWERRADRVLGIGRALRALHLLTAWRDGQLSCQPFSD